MRLGIRLKQNKTKENTHPGPFHFYLEKGEPERHRFSDWGRRGKIRDRDDTESKSAQLLCLSALSRRMFIRLEKAQPYEGNEAQNR